MVGKTGVARVALMTKAPVIPVAQWGANEALPPYGKLHLLPRKTLKVIAGPPVDLGAYYGLDPTPDVLREVTDVIMAAISAQLSELRGKPAPAVRFDPRKQKGISK
jgi:1-acyl-sn-glycerol-3-phosphate acyltransferase